MPVRAQAAFDHNIASTMVAPVMVSDAHNKERKKPLSAEVVVVVMVVMGALGENAAWRHVAPPGSTCLHSATRLRARASSLTRATERFGRWRRCSVTEGVHAAGHRNADVGKGKQHIRLSLDQRQRRL